VSCEILARDLLGVLLHTKLSVTDDIELDTLTLWQRDPWLVSLSDDHDVLDTSSESMSFSILQVNNIERSWVLFTVVQDSNTTNVVSSGDHAHVSVLELDEVFNLSGLDVQSDGIVSLGLWVWESNSSSIMSGDVVDTLSSLLNVLDAAELVRSFLLGDLVDDESTLGVVQHTEVLLGLVERDDIHKSSWVGVVGFDFSVNLNQSLDHDRLGFLEVQGVFQTVTQQDDHRKALTLFVRTRRWLWRPHTGKLIQHPVRWRSHALHVLLWTSCHGLGRRYGQDI